MTSPPSTNATASPEPHLRFFLGLRGIARANLPAEIIAGVTLAGFQSVMLIRMPDIGVATPTIVVGALAVSSLAAAWVPTRRALSIRPSEALASE